MRCEDQETGIKKSGTGVADRTPTEVDSTVSVPSLGGTEALEVWRLSPSSPLS